MLKSHHRHVAIGCNSSAKPSVGHSRSTQRSSVQMTAHQLLARLVSFFVYAVDRALVVFTIIPAISFSNFTATSAVMFEISQRGLYSTMSAPTIG